MSDIYDRSMTALTWTISFSGGGSSGGGGNREGRQRQQEAARRRGEPRAARQAEIAAGLRPGLSTQERNDNLRNGALTAAGTAATGVGAPKAGLAGAVVGGGGMVIDSFD